MIAFGPVPSRRLGYSLGINHIPPKHCTYSCVYCQVGRTTSLEINRRQFYPLTEIIDDVGQAIFKAREHGQTIEFLTLVPDGEPTLELQLGELIEALKQFETPIAVISNASLIDHLDVQDALLQADWVSLKVDVVEEVAWQRINRPHGQLSLPAILNGMLSFRSRYHGELVTETMLISRINDNEIAIKALSNFLLELQPFRSYLSIPTRPPAEPWVKPPEAGSLQQVLSVFAVKCPFSDLLFAFEEDDFASTGDLVEDILAITAVHPLRKSALRKMISQAGGDWNIVESLIISGQLACITYRDEIYYLRGDRK